MSTRFAAALGVAWLAAAWLAGPAAAHEGHEHAAAPPLPFIPAEAVGSPIMVMLVCYTGHPETGQRLIDPLRALGTPLVDMVAPMPYPAMFQFGALLPKGPRAQVDAGLGKVISRGTVTLIPPTQIIKQAIEVHTIDGPGSSAAGWMCPT